MKYMLMSASIILTLLSGIAEARIGESVEQCISRYGKPIMRTERPEGQEEIIFKKDYFTISANFFHGVCDSIYYSKSKKTFWRKEEENIPLSEGEIGVFMEANAFGKTWTSFSESDYLYWTEDRDLEAHYWKDLRILSISSRNSRERSLDEAYKYSERRRSNEIEKVKTHLSGF